MTNNKGFSIVEMVVVMAVFIGLMLIISSTFENIIRTGGQQMRSAETNTEGIVGLEMLRSDLEHAGFGLPWTYPVSPFPAIVETTAGTGVAGITTSAYNETTAPKAIQVGISTTTGRAYLVVKSTRVALNDTVQKWAYVNYATLVGTNTSSIKRWGTNDDFTVNNSVITINSTFTTTGQPDRRLVMDGPTADPNYYYTIPNTTPVYPPDAFKPGDGSQLYVVYGVDPSNTIRMPYNRADYYVKPSADMADSCNSGTGILYKGIVQQGTLSPGGTFVEYPLLNCVGDMQVEFELDPNEDGNIAYSSTLTGMSASDIRSKLRNVRVYILAHEGKKDRNYSYPNDTIKVGDRGRPASSGRTWDSTGMQTTFGAEWRNYRWKVYTIVVRPKNLS